MHRLRYALGALAMLVLGATIQTRLLRRILSRRGYDLRAMLDEQPAPPPTLDDEPILDAEVHLRAIALESGLQIASLTRFPPVRPGGTPRWIALVVERTTELDRTTERQWSFIRDTLAEIARDIRQCRSSPASVLPGSP